MEKLRINDSSSLSNALGSSAAVGWYGCHTGYQNYGPRQVILISYADIPISSVR